VILHMATLEQLMERNRKIVENIYFKIEERFHIKGLKDVKKANKGKQEKILKEKTLVMKVIDI
jgi:hypothetical protein